MTARWDILPIKRHLGLRLAEVVCDWHFQVNGTWLLVQSGFRFDGASIPFPLWPIVAFPFAPWVWIAALIHDWFYRYHAEQFAWVWCADVCRLRPLTRREVDRIFLHVLVSEINRLFHGDTNRRRIIRARLMWRARAMYLAVRSFASGYWD